jgi:hypothetical protein
MVLLDRSEVSKNFRNTFIFHLKFVFTLNFLKMASVRVGFSPGSLSGEGVSAEQIAPA